MAEDLVRRSGLVVALQANYCWVRLDEDGPGGVDRLLCTRRARLACVEQCCCIAHSGGRRCIGFC